MALLSSSISAAAEKAIEGAIERSQAGDPNSLSAISDPSQAELATASAQPLYGLDLPRLVQGKPFDAAAIHLGERYLLWRNQNPIGSAEIREVLGRPLRASLFFGPAARNTEAALEAAEKLPIVREHDYEVRLLTISGLYLMALWLKAKKSPLVKDLIVPVAPAPEGLEALRQYDVPAFESWVKTQIKGIREAGYSADR